jgi:hypothetical protein
MEYLIFSNKECISGEYFGLYVPDRMETSKRLQDYVKKTDRKIKDYENVNFKKLYIYPEDLKNDMVMLKNKINNISNAKIS